MRFPVSKPCLTGHERSLVNSAILDCQLTQGQNVLRFEHMLREYLGTPHVVAVTSGTTALHLALAGLGIGPGDEVLVPDLTYVSTANAVRYVGAKVVLVDIDLHTGCMDPLSVASRVTERTRAMLPVHLYGVPCDLTALWQAAGHGVLIIEDAAEGFGGRYAKGLAPRMGTVGDAGCFSFYGNKLITTGEGGAVITKDKWLADKMRSLRGCAQDPNRRYYHTEVGFNYRMTDLQAAVGIGQMMHLEAMVEARHQIMDRYTQQLFPGRVWNRAYAPWLFTALLPPEVSRSYVQKQLEAVGIETRPTFIPLHQLPMYRDNDDRKFPNATYWGSHGISLPTHPELTLDQVDEIANEVKGALEEC